MRTPPALRFSLTLSLPFAHQRPHSLRISPSSSTSSSWRRWLDPLPFLFPHLRWESPGLPESSLVPRTPLSSPPPPRSLSSPLILRVPWKACSLWTGAGGQVHPPVGEGGGGFLRGVPQSSQKGQTAFWLPSVESQSESPVLLWVSKSHLWAKRIIKTFSQTFEAAFQTASCQFPS